MAFEAADFDEFIRYLDANPDLRDQFRRRILSDDFLRLPIEFQEMKEAIVALAAGQLTLTAGLGTLTARVDTLTARVDTLTASVQDLSAEVRKLGAAVDGLSGNVAEYVGPMYELLFDRKAPSLFGEWLRKPFVVALDDVPGFEETDEAGGYTVQELRRLRQLDLVVRGLSRGDAKQETFLAVEISRTIDLEDVDRAIERAGLLARGGAHTLAAVAGKSLTDRALLRTQETGTIVRLLDSVA